MKKAIMMYSLGKDSSAAFVKAKEQGYDVDHIICMFNEEREISQVHMAKKKLIMHIASKMNVKVTFIDSEKDFNKQWKNIYLDVKKQGYDYMIHGDIYLEDVREFKDNHAKGSGVENVYPLWMSKEKSGECAKMIIEMGVDSIITVTNKDELKKFIGKRYSEVLPQLPKDIDPCGENGEFHTIVCKAPFLPKELEFTLDPVKELVNTYKENDFKYWYTIATDFKEV